MSSDTKRRRRGAGGRGASSRTEPARKLLEFPGSRRREKKQDTEVALGTVVRAHSSELASGGHPGKLGWLFISARSSPCVLGRRRLHTLLLIIYFKARKGV